MNTFLDRHEGLHRNFVAIAWVDPMMRLVLVMMVMVVGGGTVPSLDVVPPTVFRLLPNCWLRWLQVLTHEVQWIIESAAPRRLCRWRRNGELLRIIVVLMWVWVGRDGA